MVAWWETIRTPTWGDDLVNRVVAGVDDEFAGRNLGEIVDDARPVARDPADRQVRGRVTRVHHHDDHDDHDDLVDHDTTCR